MTSAPTNKPNVGTKLPQCPNCGWKFDYSRVDLVKAFKCPSCGSKLAVSEAYMKNLRRTTELVTLLVSVMLGLRNAFLLLLAPVVLFLVSMVGGIISKRLFPPHIEDVVARSKEARYTPL